MRLGKNFRGVAKADRVLGYIRVRQGRNAVLLTDKQLRKLARLVK